VKVKLIHVTPDAEKHIAYCARVSSKHQDNPEYAKLIAYCIKHGHWSILEMASMCVEITTSRAIAAQILRHKSFSFQEFSQRYAEAAEREIVEPRLQDTKNRQNSLVDEKDVHGGWFKAAQDAVWEQSKRLYDEALSRNIAKEQARFLLPLATQTRMYMHGNIRSWATYLQVRCDPSTQKEHRDIANAIKAIFIQELPTIGEALGWNNVDNSEGSL